MANPTCQEKLAELESVLNKVMNEPMFYGTVIAGPVNGFYRVSTEGGDKFLPFNPQEKKVTLKIGDGILFNRFMITQLIPEGLIVQPDPVNFKPLKWEAIGGMKSQITQIREAIEGPVKNAKLYKEFGIEPSKGVLLYGPPGCGKTMIAKAIASTIVTENITDDSFIYLKGGEMLQPYVGMAENNIKAVFTRTRNYAKKYKQRAVIFIDEAEAIMPTRGSRRSSDVDTTIVPTFLAEMDGFEEGNPFIILATNLPKDIDSAIIRPGRIDLKVEVSRPDLNDMCEIFHIYLKGTKLADDIDLLASTSSQLLSDSGIPPSGALISNIVTESVKRAIKRKIENPTSIAGVVQEDLKSVILNLA